jgi:hypothetical protein
VECLTGVLWSMVEYGGVQWESLCTPQDSCQTLHSSATPEIYENLTDTRCTGVLWSLVECLWSLFSVHWSPHKS